MTRLSALLAPWALHQDFFWFASLVAWSFVLVLWWRHPARGTDWAWLPWAGGAAVATALVQFGVFNPSFDLFVDRLVPGTRGVYHRALLDPYRLGDLLTGVALAVQIAGWGWIAARRSGRRAHWCFVAAGLPLVVGGLRTVAPNEGGWLLALLALVAAGWGWRFREISGGMRLVGALTALMPAFSTVGPVAAWVRVEEPLARPEEWGVVAAGFSLLAGGAGLLGIARGAMFGLGISSWRVFWRDSRGFVLAGVGLLAAGLAYAVVVAHDNRNEILRNRLRQTAGQAMTCDPQMFGVLARLPLEVGPVAADDVGDRPWLLPVPGLTAAEFAPIRRKLDETMLALPFVEAARLLVLRGDWLVAVFSSHPVGPPGTVEVVRRANAADRWAWLSGEPYVEEGPQREIGEHYYTRGPIVGPDGKVVALLEHRRVEYYLSVERRWRAGPLLVTAFGLTLLALAVAQRWNSRARMAAERAAALATEASRLKADLLAKVSHELRTPLQGILGQVELLQRDARDDAQRARLSAIRRQGELMTRLVGDLLDLGMIDAGSFRLVEQVVDPTEVVRHTIESLRPQAAAKGLALQFATGAEVPPWARLDAERLRQIVLNLAGNAVKFTTRGGVMVALRGLSRPAEGGTLLELEVADTGPGIPPEMQGRIFEPFHRLDLTGEVEGVGLGLAVVASLCRTMGGDVAVESDGCHGSRLRARFRAQPAPRPAPAVDLATGTLRGLRVLVADDNALVRELFVAHLSALGAACVEAADGEAAITQAAGCAAVVLDLAMPRADGREVARRLRAAGFAGRIVGVSAHADPVERERALAAGMDEFHAKPVALDRLARALAPGITVAATGPDETLLARLAGQFRGDAAEQAGRLEGKIRRRAWHETAAAAHHLKNSAAVVRDDALFAACEQLERAAGLGDGPRVTSAWAECATALARWRG